MMFKSVTAKSFIAVAAAAIVAGLIVGVPAFLTSIVPNAEAASPVAGVLHQPQDKGDRLRSLVKGAACSSRGWPNYEQRCQFDLRRPANEARSVRLIALR